MAYMRFGRVKIGRNTVELRGNSGIVSDTQRTSHTGVTADSNNDSTANPTSDWIDFALKLDDGRTMNITTKDSIAPVSNGDRVTGFWGHVNGRERPEYLAFYNNTTGDWGLDKHERNITSGPMGHVYLMIVAAFLGGYGIMFLFIDGPGLITVIAAVLCAYFFYMVNQRRKKLLYLLNDAIERIKTGTAPAAIEYK